MRSKKRFAHLLLLLALFGPALLAEAGEEAALAAVSAVGPPS